jgi:type II secretory pathway pseudopilin PulG
MRIQADTQLVNRIPPAGTPVRERAGLRRSGPGDGVHVGARYCTAFTIVELLVTVAIIAVLIGILLPAIGAARDSARVNTSRSNLRQLGQAHVVYAAAWNGRQFTLVDDRLAAYGTSIQPAVANFAMLTGDDHPPIVYGWGWGDDGAWHTFGRTMGHPWNTPLLLPVAFDSVGPFGSHFGWFRIPNCDGFIRYVNDRHYDPIFYAPKDEMVLDAVEPCLESPREWHTAECWHINIGGWASYCLSPAALYAPAVMRNEGAGGWQEPFTLDSSLKVPSMSQARYPDRKTHMLEHHWLQNTRAECNPGFEGYYDGCEPYYFNHSWESVPMTLFFDGHVDGLGVREAEAADARVHRQTGTHGLWNRSTPWQTDGYLHELGYDFAATSFHILTNDGIRGRDALAR